MNGPIFQARNLSPNAAHGHSPLSPPHFDLSDEPAEIAGNGGGGRSWILKCDCCGQNREKLPFHHEAHDDSGDSWDYCQECYDAGCDLTTCSL